jgi:hypothetical protein
MMLHNFSLLEQADSHRTVDVSHGMMAQQAKISG